MAIKNRFNKAGVLVIMFIACIPVAMLLTIFTTSFWLWIENTLKIEAVGHSGPAEWCYIAVYLILVTICILVWWFAKRSDAK